MSSAPVWSRDLLGFSVIFFPFYRSDFPPAAFPPLSFSNLPFLLILFFSPCPAEAELYVTILLVLALSMLIPFRAGFEGFFLGLR